MSKRINQLQEHTHEYFYEFGSFRLDPRKRLLKRDGELVPLTPKAFDTLLALVEQSGRVMEKGELMRQVWADTIVEEGGLTRNISVLRKALGESLDEHSYIVTVPGRGYRFVATVKTIPIESAESPEIFESGSLVVETHTLTRIVSEEEVDPLQILQNQTPATYIQNSAALDSRPAFFSFRNPRFAILMGLSLAALVVVAGLLFYLRKHPALTEKDTILLADFTNLTTDPAFDGTLKQGLAVQLEQSPFLSTFPDTRVRQTLRLMGRPMETRVTGEIAQEICQRQGLKALISGTIASLGSHYVITLEAISHNGEPLARTQVEAENKESVISALSTATDRMREKLGESLSSIQKFSVPLQVMTPSLEALKAYSLGYEQAGRGKWLEAIPIFQHAVDLDPNFAAAHAMLASCYNITHQQRLAAENATLAYKMRDRVNERERLRADYFYYIVVTGELDKAIETLELTKQTYPRDGFARLTLSHHYLLAGKYENALVEAQVALNLTPGVAAAYLLIGRALIKLNRLAEAKAIYEQARQQKLDTTRIHGGLYEIAFANQDSAEMQRSIDAVSGRTDEYLALNWQASAMTSLGQWRRGQEFEQRAIDLAASHNLKEVVAEYTANIALRSATCGKCAQAKIAVTKALGLERNRSSLSLSALALALCGEINQSQSLVDELTRSYPKDTFINSVWIPATRAALELQRGNATAAIESLQPPNQYQNVIDFWPQYLRGQAYLRLQAGDKAAMEFQNVLDHRCQAMLSALFPLAYLGLARASALTGNAARSRQAYSDFFALWKNAEPDLPMLIEAKKEFERMK